MAAARLGEDCKGLSLHGSDDGEPAQEAPERRIEMHGRREVDAQAAERLAQGVPVLVERHGGSARLRHIQREGSRGHHWGG